jgi:hypothetical protein
MPGTSSAKTRFALLPGHDEREVFKAANRLENYSDASTGTR